VGLGLGKREIKSFQYLPYRCQGRVYFPAQRRKIVCIADAARLQFPARLMPVPYCVDAVESSPATVSMDSGSLFSPALTHDSGHAALLFKLFYAS